MAAPALSVPVRANLDAFKQQMNETSSIAKTAGRKVAQAFLDANKELAGSAASAAFSGMASSALKLTGQIALVIGAAKLMGDAIGAARNQLKEMVDLQNKSQNAGVSAGFFQSFSAEARRLQIDVGDLEGALTNAFNATKDKAPVDLALWDTGKDRITEVERALRIYNETVAKAAGQRLEGLVLFREADSQEAKVQAVLKAMVRLEQIGQKAAALDIGEKMFGVAFVDRIRQGRTSAESILSTMEKMQSSDDGIYSSALVARAKAVDDNLRQAEDRLSRALKPSFDDLSSTILTIKNLWADIVGYISQAVALANKLGILGSEVSRLKQRRDELDDAIKNGNEISVFGIKTGIRVPNADFGGENEKERVRVQAQIEDLERQPNVYPKQLARTGTGDRPTLKPTGTTSDVDKFDTAAGAVEKRTAALQAEAAAIDLGTEARDRAKVAAQLETVAKQANAAAGLGANVVTAEQRKVIDEVAQAYANAAVAMEKAKIDSSIKFGKQTGLLDPQDVQIAQQLKGLYPDVATALGSVEAQAMRANEAMRGISSVVSTQLTTGLANILDGTKSVSQGFQDMSKAIIRALQEALIKMLIVQPIMRSMQGLFGFSGGGAVGATGLSLAGTGGLYDSGGYTGSGGKYEPAGIVHRGEVVWSQRDVARAGGVATVEAMRLGYRGYDGGGIVTAPASAASPSRTSGTSVAPSISFGNINISVPPGTNIENPQQMGRMLEATVGKIVNDKLSEAMRYGGMLNRR